MDRRIIAAIIATNVGLFVHTQLQLHYTKKAVEQFLDDANQFFDELRQAQMDDEFATIVEKFDE